MSASFPQRQESDLGEREYKVRIIERLGQLEQRLNNQGQKAPNEDSA